MGRERLSRGFLLRLGVLLTAACVAVHVYLETGWREAPARPTVGHSRQPGHDRGQQSRTKQVSAAAERRERSVKRRISYVQTAKRESPARRRNRDRGDSSSKPRWHITLEPWASESRSLEDEAKRFLNYITTPQLSCSLLAGKEGAAQGGSKGAWQVCFDSKYSLTHRMESKHCRVYSFGLGADDRSLERFLAKSGCEVHCFDPSLKLPHLQQAEMWLHRLSVDWRDPNPALVAQRQYANTKKLATILNDFGHRQVDVLKADIESAEWKILENLILEGVLDSVGQLLLELHLHWPGFEVAGDDPSVVRYWFSLLKELERAKFHLFNVYSDPGRPHLFLHKNVFNASSAYTLSWVKTDWTF